MLRKLGIRRFFMRFAHDAPGRSEPRAEFVGSARARVRSRERALERLVGERRIVRLVILFTFRHSELPDGGFGLRMGETETFVVDRALNLISFTKRVIAPTVRVRILDLSDRIDEVLSAAHRCVRSAGWLKQPEAAMRAQERRVWLTAVYSDGSVELRAAPCDRNAIPEDPWLELMRAIKQAMKGPMKSRLLFEPAFQSAKAGEAAFANVRYEGTGRGHFYLVGDLAVSVGNWVVVPSGRENYGRLALVTDVRIYPAGEAPCPPEKAKKILQKYTG